MKDDIRECHVKRTFLRNGIKKLEWKIMPVADALIFGATEFRCKDCHGSVKLHDTHVPHGPAPHVEHKSKQDSEYCPAGFYFKQHPGREPRLSLHPVA